MTARFVTIRMHVLDFSPPPTTLPTDTGISNALYFMEQF
jgi:hypothetical protein